MGNAPDILDTQSPYWLRLYGHWIHLQGIMPVNDVEPQRAFSELVTVDGYRYEQRAPRGPRSWELPYRFGTAAATAALESAAYDVALNDAASGITLFLDTNQAKVNMLPPEFPTQDQVDSARAAINAGGVWLPSTGTSLIDISVPVRAGVAYTIAGWTIGSGAAIQLTTAAGAPLVSDGGTGTGTPTAPELLSATYTSPTDQTVRFLAVAPASTAVSLAGLMLFEGNCPPEFYRRGRRMPCEVSVHDPKITNNLIWRYCDPCKLPREHAVFTVNEVGTFPATVAS
jgi:hypothetical protein